MKKGMTLLLYTLGAIWTVVGLLILMGAWHETETDYEPVTGKVSQPLELSYEEHEAFGEPRVVMAKLYLEDDEMEYRLRGKLYHLNRQGMESVQVGETLRLMVKKTAIVGGFGIDSTAQSAPVSGVYRANGEALIPLEKGIEHAKQRLWIGFGFIVLGLLVGIGTYLKA